MVATGGRVTAAGLALAVAALLLPGLAYATAVLSETAAQPVTAAQFVTSGRSEATSHSARLGRLAAVGRPVAAARPVSAVLSASGTGSCRGIRYRIIPARGDISNVTGTEGGYLWWRSGVGRRIVCIGTIRMWVHYPEREYARWLVRIYAPHMRPDFIGNQNFTLNSGTYYWDFPVHENFQDADSLCLTAEFAAGPNSGTETSCTALG